ncbi:alpha-galactosidase [uncultured Eubacterium sp.]|uniref:alpha-galactosidase n=1 Tax=uncultured Eubacterium sp. TaxID=165185 RepID=UPI002598BD70|nr:alpha-galactosidase [uncultured Eubacterium sp.]
MIRNFDNEWFVFDTKNTTYAFRVIKTGQLEHLYYGEKIRIEEKEDLLCLAEQHAYAPGATANYTNEYRSFSLDDMRLEISTLGKSDLREPFIEVINSDGCRTSDFLFESASVLDKKSEINTLPSSYIEYKEEGNETIDNKDIELQITLADDYYKQKLILIYDVFYDKDVITKRAVFKNDGDSSISLLRLMSNQLDFATNDYTLTTFNGAWAREMQRNDRRLTAGKFVNSSRDGISSNKANPFVMIYKNGATENTGECYGINLVYSGNHYEACEVSAHYKLRFVHGINPDGFNFVIDANEEFETPESVMTYSKNGFNGMSQNMHRFVRENIVRGNWKNKIRPVLLNSWEAAYFDINESKLLKLAKASKDVGIELFVMDDGWFGKRDDDSCSLGDWYVDKKKLPNGLGSLAKKVNDLGLMFGIWVEPEMVSVDSDLYREHPDWAMDLKDKPHSEGRTQRILDFCNPDVVEYIINAMSDVFASANISYVKWDMNRVFTDVYSKYLPIEKQGEVYHRYVMGLYKVMATLTEKFPDILFEGCASGGNRFDLGILSYFPQIWASDDTDCLYRVTCQTGYSYGYPMSTVSAHVSASPNHQTLRKSPLDTRFNVAAFGNFGYEINLCDLKKEELAIIKRQIETYKNWRDVFQFGSFYRGRRMLLHGEHTEYRNEDVFGHGNINEWTVVSKDKKAAVGMIIQALVEPNKQYEYFKPMGLDSDVKYHFTNESKRYNIKNFGDLINTASPVHIKQDSLLHNIIARHVTMPGECEDYVAYGSVLMNAGINLKQAFGGTGYDESVRYFQDLGSRMYFMEGE